MQQQHQQQQQHLQQQQQLQQLQLQQQQPPGYGRPPPPTGWRAPSHVDPHGDARLQMLENELLQIKQAKAQQHYDQLIDQMITTAPPPPSSSGQVMIDYPDRNSPMQTMHSQSYGALPVARPQDHSSHMQSMHGPSYGATMGAAGRSQEHQELLTVHKEVLVHMSSAQLRHNELLAAHGALMKAHSDLIKIVASGGGGAGGATGTGKKKHPCLGVVRLDYNYPPAAGDTDCPGSFGYDVTYRVVPGLTFELVQAGKIPEKVERAFADAIKFLEMKGVNAITGDCGFMMAFQVLARKIATAPVFMSSMVQCPLIACAYDPGDQILVLTANEKSLSVQKEVLLNSCGFDVDEDRFIIKGCQDIPGFDAVSRGEAVPLDIVQPGVVRMTMEIIKQYPKINAILLECSELPPYADALRAATGLSVFDAITAADFYVNASKDNPRFGIDDWQAEWDGAHEDYSFGQNLVTYEKETLVNKLGTAKAKAKADPKAKSKANKLAKDLKKKQAPTLGVVRLDYNYPPTAGDIDCPASYGYDVIFRCVPGLTFAMAQSGKMTEKVRKEFVDAIKWLEARGVCGITGDCGFMMAFQPLAAEVATCPVFMSSMVQCPMISVAFDKYDKVAVLTANSETLGPQKDHLLSGCGFDVDDDRFVIIGCQDVPGFDAVARGAKVDVDYVTPGMVKMMRKALAETPSIRAICLECTELPPYSDALRKEFGLPVFDAITCADFFVSARKDNPRFGLNEWQVPWDGTVEEYVLGQNLAAEQKKGLKSAK
mmetsp:Transcript_44552/g.117735  ORF Transcript_44552/g.117735 Transcript_44552/m.117735 type:complete len:769 (-) Transcript_44552:210-2516(-)